LALGRSNVEDSVVDRCLDVASRRRDVTEMRIT